MKDRKVFTYFFEGLHIRDLASYQRWISQPIMYHALIKHKEENFNSIH